MYFIKLLKLSAFIIVNTFWCPFPTLDQSGSGTIVNANTSNDDGHNDWGNHSEKCVTCGLFS